MSRDFPVRPNLEQLKHQAKDLLKCNPRMGSPEASPTSRVPPQSAGTCACQAR